MSELWVGAILFLVAFLLDVLCKSNDSRHNNGKQESKSKSDMVVIPEFKHTVIEHAKGKPENTVSYDFNTTRKDGGK